MTVGNRYYRWTTQEALVRVQAYPVQYRRGMSAALSRARLLISLFAVGSLAVSAEAAVDTDTQTILRRLDVTLEVTQRPAWPAPPASELKVALIPQTGEPGRCIVSFGIPFGPHWLYDHELIRVLDAEGREIPAFTKPLAHWWLDGKQGSLRSVLVQFEAVFDGSSPRQVTVLWDRARTRSRPTITPIPETQTERLFQPAAGSGRAESYRYLCPAVLALLSPEWLCASLLAWQQIPISANRVAPWFDAHLAATFEGSLAGVSARRFSAHLFDRPATYAKIYARSGEAQHLLAALQAVEFYLRHLGSDGFFDLKPAKDVKYVFAEGFALMYMLTGDDRYVEGIGRALKAWPTFARIEYRGEGFWTERHHGFGMLAYLHAYELTGDPRLLALAKRYFEAVYHMQLNPGHGGEPDGAWPHTGTSHSDGASEHWVTSPWMSAFLADAIWKYWMLTGDSRCPVSLAMYAKFTQRHSVAPDGRSVAYLTASGGRGKTIRRGGASHNMEAAYLLGMGYYLSGGADRSLLRTIEALYPPLMDDDANSPPRKFTWRFRETSMLVWFLTQGPAARQSENKVR
jgi:hypothetical protein